MTSDQVRGMLRAACKKAGSLRAWARQHDLSAAYVSDVLLGRRAPGPAILEAFGLKAERVVETIYRKAKANAR
jgi:hypothetical protein